MLADRADNDLTYRRAAKLDNQKRAAALALEDALETAALWSLAGVNAVLLNQWPASFHGNRRLMTRLFDALNPGGAHKLALGDALAHFAAAERAHKARMDRYRENERRGREAWAGNG